ncbi:UNVERIFIED_CONTAM: hypothetical protein K2H54_041250 [Gekko kuhli]
MLIKKRRKCYKTAQFWKVPWYLSTRTNINTLKIIPPFSPTALQKELSGMFYFPFQSGMNYSAALRIKNKSPVSLLDYLLFVGCSFQVCKSTDCKCVAVILKGTPGSLKIYNSAVALTDQTVQPQSLILSSP